MLLHGARTTPRGTFVPMEGVTATAGDTFVDLEWPAGAVTVTVLPSGDQYEFDSGSERLYGLPNGEEHTIIVAGSGGQGASVRATPALDPANPRYGPSGDEWPSMTPHWGAAATTTVTSWSDLVTALRTAGAGAVIHLDDSVSGAWGSQNLNDATARTNLAGFSGADQNVLIRSAPGSGVTFTDLRIDVPNVTVAYVTILGPNHATLGYSVQLYGNADRSKLARIKVADQAQISLASSSRAQLVGVVAERGTNTGGDRLQISALTGQPVDDVQVLRCWLDRVRPAVSAHSDGIQWTALTGEHRVCNTYVGPQHSDAGGNQTVQAGMEVQGDLTPGDVTFRYVYFGGRDTGGSSNGNALGVVAGFGQSYVSCEFDRLLGVLTTAATLQSEIAMSDVDVEPASVNTTDGQSLASVFPGVTLGVSITEPTLTQPSWWGDF